VDSRFFNVRDPQDLREVVVVLAGVRNLRDVREMRDAVHIQPAPIALVMLRGREWVRGQDWLLRRPLAASRQAVRRLPVVRDNVLTIRDPKKGP